MGDTRRGRERKGTGKEHDLLRREMARAVDEGPGAPREFEESAEGAGGED